MGNPTGHRSMTILPRVRGTIFVVSGPSGSGKSRVIREVLSKVSEIEFSISATTRERRQYEVDGRDYYFVTHDRFAEMIRNHEFLEYAEVYGNLYGTPREYIDRKTASGVDIIMDVDIQGARQIRANCPEAVLLFLLPPSIDVLSARIEKRDSDDQASVERRMRSAVEEIRCIDTYDYAIVNDRLDECVANVVHIVRAERSRTDRLDTKGLSKLLGVDNTNE